MAIPHNLNPLGYSKNKSGSGTSDDPYLIWTADDFRVFRNTITDGTTFAGKYHKLMANIDLTGVSFKPALGSENYSGDFNGNFKVISNFKSVKLTNSATLFRTVSGRIHHLGIEEINIDNGIGVAPNIGGITMSHIGVIENCYVTGIITSGTGATLRVGGIAGYCSGSTIRNCWTNVKINGLSTRYGGIAGNLGGTISNCYALGDILSQSVWIGGIAGLEDNGVISNCVAGMQKINGMSNIGRIIGESVNNTNNHALNTMLVNGSTVSGTVTSQNGENATIEQLKSLAFYRDTMTWDMENIWQIDDGVDFPKLRGFPFTKVIPKEATYVEAVFVIPYDNYVITNSRLRVYVSGGTTVVIDWGDGTVTEVTRPMVGLVYIAFSKIYSKAGRYTVRIYEAEYGHNATCITFNDNPCIESINRLQGLGIVDLGSLCADNYDTSSIFKEFNADFSLVPNVTTLQHAFLNCKQLRTPIPSLAPLTKLRSLTGAWHRCSNIQGTALPVIASASPTVESHSYTFRECTGLSDYDLIPITWK